MWKEWRQLPIAVPAFAGAFLGNFANRPSPVRQNFVAAAASRLSEPVTRGNALTHVPADFAGNPPRRRISPVSGRVSLVLAIREPSIRTLPTLALYTTVLPGHLQRSAMMHFSHSGLRATQV